MDESELRKILATNGMLETVAGDFIALSIIGRIIPLKDLKTAIAKDKHGNRLAYLKWVQLGSDDD